MGTPILFGRESALLAVTEADERFTLVVGDSGIGKSSFLSALERWSEGALVAQPIVLTALEGSLQTALADALGDCLQQFADTTLHDPQAAFAAMKAVAQRAKGIAGKEIAQMVIAGTVSYLESKVGKEAVASGKRVLRDLKGEGALGLSRQITALRAEDRLGEVADVAATLAAASGRKVVIRLDNAERLSPSDRGFLVELPSALRGDVRVIVCVTPHHADGDDIIQEVQVRGYEPHDLLPLDRPAIEAWLASAGVPRAQWDAVARASSGYPLFISDAVRLAGAQVSFSQMNAPVSFSTLMRATWKKTELALREKAAMLAPFLEPPGNDFLLAYLALSPLQWGIVADQLVDAGIFIRRADGSTWFHDRRRAFLWTSVLQPAERAHVSAHAFASVAAWVDGKKEMEGWVPSAAALLARDLAPSVVGTITHQLLRLSDDGIALLWGLVEVVEPITVGAPWAEINEVVRHAEARARRDIDVIANLTELESLGLIATHEERDVRLIRSRVEQNADYAALLGEIERRFHVVPLPHFATAAFEAFLRPLLAGFESAGVSMGYATSPQEKEHLRALAPRGASNTFEHGLAGTITVDDQHISFGARYTTAEAQHRAKAELEKIATLTSRAELVTATTWPQPRVRFARFERARSAVRYEPRAASDPDIDTTAFIFDQRARYYDKFTAISTLREREALRLAPRRFLIDSTSDPRSLTAFEVEGSFAPTEDISKLGLGHRDPLLELRLRAQGRLAPRERIVRTTTYFGPNIEVGDPLSSVIKSVGEAGKRYNNGLRTVLIPPDSAVIETEIRVELQRLRPLIDVIAELEGQPPVPSPTLLVGFWESPDAGWGGDFGNWLACVFAVDDSEGDVVVKHLRDRPDSRHPARRSVPDVFPDHAGRPVTRWSEGAAASVIAPLVGYTYGDVRFTDVSGPMADIWRKHFDILGAIS